MSQDKGHHSLYRWAYRAGMTMRECLSGGSQGGREAARNKMRSFILSLRSELTPERFRRALVDQIISVMTDCDRSLSLPSELKEERSWTVDEFYRYSTAILAGLYEAVFTSESRESEVEQEV
ncbi:MAG: hypothetical protein NZ992_00295 [Candidatus Korarchaeum sp.]|nr:hypothetical protein [Candidatus Korarchaeum sp.]MDW8035252.1 hypothetical protein [Candidatus Korarchaeum sp.]